MWLDLVIKATLLLIGGFVLSALLRHASAATRHTVWTTVFVAILLLPVARLIMPEWAVLAWPERLAQRGSATIGTAQADSVRALLNDGTVAVTSPWSGLLRPATVALLVWAAGTFVSLLWIIAGIIGTRRLEQAAHRVQDPRVKDRAIRVAASLGVRRSVRLLSVSNEVMPSTWGLVTPRVLLPDEASHWTNGRLDAVLTHELSHVVRGDAASHLSARLATALWWWHPLVWMGARQAKFERERACDDLVLTQGACASDYAADLVTFVSSLHLPLVQQPATLAMARRSQLEGRVMAILKSDVNRRGVSQAGFMAALLVMALVWPLAAARPAAAKEEPQDPVRIGGAIQAPRKIKDVKPIYPESAKADGRQGVAIIEAVIDAEGNVSEAKVIRSIGADLDDAAVDAVMQWRFVPTMLNGRPVPVIMTVTVNFTLTDGMPPPPPPPPTDPVVRPDMPPPPPPPPPAPVVTADGEKALRIGGQVAPPTKIKHVSPVYPDVARAAGKTGIVIIEATIDAQGNVTNVKVIRSVDMLDDAARDAVLQWKFTPTIYEGVPVPVIMTVTVNFSLQ